MPAEAATRPWLRPIIVVALNQALRIGEVAGLQRSDVDFARDTLRVHLQLSREGTLALTNGSRRDRRDANPIDFLPDARATLLNLFTEDVAESGFVFHDRNGKPRQPRDIARAFQRLVDKAALLETEDGKVTFHALRARSAGTEEGLSGNG